MRGEDRGSQGFFSYVRLEERIAADHPLRAIRDLIDEAAAEVVALLQQTLRARRTTIDPAGAAVASPVAAGVLHSSIGTAIDGAARLQSIVPLVCRAIGRRSSVGCDCVLQESGPAAQRRYCAQVHDHGAEPATGALAVVERA